MATNQYSNLLKAILDNARNLKNAAVVLLRASLDNNNLRPYAQFMLYASIEECGKFLLILDLLPKALSNKILKSIGFYDHELKIKRLARNIQKYRPQIQRDNNKIARDLRKHLREISLYVDFRDSKVIPPQFVKNIQSLNHLTSLVINCIKFCEFKLTEFKK